MIEVLDINAFGIFPGALHELGIGSLHLGEELLKAVEDFEKKGRGNKQRESVCWTHIGNIRWEGGGTGWVCRMPKSKGDGPDGKEADAVLFARCNRSPKEQMGDQHHWLSRRALFS